MKRQRPANEVFLGKVWRYMHTRAEHSESAAVRKRWLPAYRAFMRRHYGEGGNGNVRWVNKFTNHRWN